MCDLLVWSLFFYFLIKDFVNDWRCSAKGPTSERSHTLGHNVINKLSRVVERKYIKSLRFDKTDDQKYQIYMLWIFYCLCFMLRKEKNCSCVIFLIFMVGFSNYTSYLCKNVLSNFCFLLCCHLSKMCYTENNVSINLITYYFQTVLF